MDGKSPDAPSAPSTTILDHERAFWAAFVTDGRLDAVKMEQAGYTAVQAVWIEGEMKRLCWLYKEKYND